MRGFTTNRPSNEVDPNDGLCRTPHGDAAATTVSIHSTRADLPILAHSTLRSLASRKTDAVVEAKERVDRLLRLCH